MPRGVEMCHAISPENLFRFGQMRMASLFAQPPGQKCDDLMILHVARRGQKRHHAGRSSGRGECVAPSVSRISSGAEVRKMLRHHSREVRGFTESTRHIAVCLRDTPALRSVVKIESHHAACRGSRSRALCQYSTQSGRQSQLFEQLRPSRNLLLGSDCLLGELFRLGSDLLPCARLQHEWKGRQRSYVPDLRIPFVALQQDLAAESGKGCCIQRFFNPDDRRVLQIAARSVWCEPRACRQEGCHLRMPSHLPRCSSHPLASEMYSKAGSRPRLGQAGNGQRPLGPANGSTGHAILKRAAAGQPSRIKSRVVAASECQSPATARPRTSATATRKPPVLTPEAKSRSSAIDMETFAPRSRHTQSTNNPAVPRPAENMLFKYEGPSPRLPPV